MKLTVQPLHKKDAGRGIAAVSGKTLKALGIENGGYIEITAGNTDQSVIARAWERLSNNYQESFIRIDGLKRQQLGVGIDDTVEVSPAHVEPAQEVEIAIPEITPSGNFEAYLKKELDGKPVSKGKVIGLKMGMGVQNSTQYRMKVISTTPEKTVIINSQTNIVLRNDLDKELDSEDQIPPEITYEDIGGLEEELEQVREMIELPMRHPELFKQLGIDPPKGVLLHGPPGTGKTLMAKAVANEVDAYFDTISGPEIMSKYYGESEEHLREVFEEAEENAPAVIFLDEIDSIAPKRDDTSGDVERRIVAQLLSLMDGLEDRGDVVVIGATNRVDSIDPALRRGGRFDREIEVGIPDQNGRKEILQVHTRDMPLDEDIDLDDYARKTHGFVGADIESMTKEAAMNALRRIRPELDLDVDDQLDPDVLEEVSVSAEDFRRAHTDVTPSALREVFVEVPDTSWDDIGGVKDSKQQLVEMVQWPLEHEDIFRQMDVDAPKGLLLYGPPGTGKTMLAKAVANESDSNFISVKGPELLNKYVGESEKGVREVFEKARENAPTVVFFDEIDAIAGERGGSVSDSGVTERVVSQLLTELDGLETLEDVVVIATTNRPDLIDSALLRPGRFDRQIHVPVPDIEAREEILRVHTEDKPLADDVDMDWVAKQTDGFVGADLEALSREASMMATREIIQDGCDSDGATVTQEHFEAAVDDMSSSVSDGVREEYEDLEVQMSGGEKKKGSPGRTFQ